MSETDPRFRVHAVVSGYQWGVLFERVFEGQRLPDNAYFYLDTPDGLVPTGEIRAACKGACYPIVSSLSADHVLLRELKAYAEAAESDGDFTCRRPVFSGTLAKGGFPRLVDHVFEHRRTKTHSHLRSFLSSAALFKARVLSPVPGREDQLAGAALAFGVLAPYEVCADADLLCLWPLNTVLQIDCDSTPTWFRTAGPLAVDFANGCVVPPTPQATALRESLLSNPYSVLLGPAGSGKTTLALYLAYTLIPQFGPRIYYVRYRDQDIGILAREIRGRRGIHIVDDIHLNPYAIASLVHRLGSRMPRRNLLLVGRSIPSGVLPPDCSLSQFPALSTDPAEHVDEIIRQYIASRPATHVHFNRSLADGIWAASGCNLCFLAHGLKGCLSREGSGTPRSWIQEGVEEHLRELGHICPEFPKILVALAPLARNEVLTAERYLVRRFGFEPATIQALHMRGEIRHATVDGQAYYGLTHSAHAEAFWDYGGQYRDALAVTDYIDFIYEYARMQASNALEAVLTMDVVARNDVLGRLGGATADLALISAPSLRVLSTLVLQAASVTKEGEQVITVIASILKRYRLDDGIGGFLADVVAVELAMAGALLRSIGSEGLAIMISQANDLHQVFFALQAVQRADPGLFEAVKAALNLDRLAEAIIHEPQSANWFVGFLYWLNGMQESIIAKLGHRITGASEIGAIMEFLHELHPQVARIVCKHVDFAVLHGRIGSDGEDSHGLMRLIVAVGLYNREGMQALVAGLKDPNQRRAIEKELARQDAAPWEP